MSLSTFLRDYLYIALGGNRHGGVRRYANLAVTMLLGGLWHGAAWSFVIWGGLHGIYLMLNHGFRALCGPARLARLEPSWLFRWLGWALTMLSVFVAWFFFRAETIAGALRMLAAMAGGGASDGPHSLLWNAGLQPWVGALWCAALGALACIAPNSNRIGSRMLEWVRGHAAVRRIVGGAALAAVLLLVLVNAVRDSVSTFIYFNF
jgi:alginate O-acetyltransferase complex protein AlgI